MSFTVDANVLVYAIEPSDERAPLARQIMAMAVLSGGVLTNQAIGEFLNVVRRKKLIVFDNALTSATDWALLFPVLPTTTEHLITAGRLAQRHRLQLWDSVILTVATTAGLTTLLSEDMQDGASFDGLRIVNPFNPANADLLANLIAPPPDMA